MRFLKGRVPAAVISAVVVAGLVGLATVAIGTAGPAVAFAQSGHWVFNRAESAVVHVDSGTRAVDARVAVPQAGGDEAFAVQGPTQGFLVGRRNITVFGKSTLTVETTIPSGQDELPVGIETVGGPYLVYKQAGTIVRLGVPPTTIPVGGPVSRPVYTDDGTVWVHRTDNGDICSLAAGESELDCSIGTPAGAPGALAITQAVAGFVDTSDDAVAIVQGAGLLPPVGVGTDLPNGALIADRDSENRLPAVTANPNRLVLTDDGGVLAGRAGAAPVVVELGPGDFSAPVAANGVVALIDLTRHRLLTFAMDGRPLGTADLPPGEGQATIARGSDGRLYIDDASGAQTHVIGRDGSITSVATGTPSDAVVSAQPDALAAVLPAPPELSSRRGDVPPVIRDGGEAVPDEGGEWTPAPQDGRHEDAPYVPPVEPEVKAPPTPTGVAARVGAGGAVTVSWNGGGGQGVTYTVTGGGNSKTGAGTTAQFTGLEAGETYTFTVVATNEGGDSGAATSNTVTIPGGPPGAPTGLRLTKDGYQGARTAWLEAAWNAPELNGGTLVHYVLTVADRTGAQVTSKTTTATALGEIWQDRCAGPFTISVVAVTNVGGRQITGPPATVKSANAGKCAIYFTVDAVANGPTNVTATLNAQETSDGVTAPCSMQFNGRTVWNGQCGGALMTTNGGKTRVPVDGLTPGTTYNVVLNMKQLDGSTRTSRTTVTTPAGGGG
ncbi:fibronectin type III domain-containing protein [Pseudonocardia sp. RS11V-5]|uniref:fibronectin type III domain-containing protein n=1 Tax=Pseudonocardia terrae TaxID=2905831 RepID=UPI001E658D28|nr:fibronectin type III domain-containing protein [Pseudonocardia terrae]MCE3552379.1 fibronectin type III domain-containing protein [Pseudonocardia terrae]